MKSQRVLKILMGIGIGIMLLCFAASIKTPGSVETFQKRYVFICPLEWENVSAGIRKADQDYNVNTKLFGSESLSSSRQAELIRQMILTGVDGIITGATEDSEALIEAVNEAEAAGIPVVFVDGDLKNSDRSCYIGTDNYSAGVQAGEEMYQSTGGSANIGIIVSELTAPNQKERLQGFKDAISGYSGMTIVQVEECHSQKLELTEKVAALLKENPQINALLITEGIASDLVGTILEEEGYEAGEYRIVSFDLTQLSIEYLKNGIYDALIVQKPYLQGYLAVETLKELSEGKEIQQEIYTECDVIKEKDAENFKSESYGDLEWQMY